MTDAVAEGPHTGVITHTLSSTDLGYNGLAPLRFIVNLADVVALGVYLPLIIK